MKRISVKADKRKCVNGKREMGNVIKLEIYKNIDIITTFNYINHYLTEADPEHGIQTPPQSISTTYIDREGRKISFS